MPALLNWIKTQKKDKDTTQVSGCHVTFNH